MLYRLNIVTDSSNLDLGTITLDDEVSWQQLISFTLISIGDQQPVRFMLFTSEGSDSPYLELALYIDIHS